MAKVLFSNWQWAVTDYGVEAVRDRYFFEASRLTEVRPGVNLYDWPIHLAEKDWVHIPSFNEAFRRALDIHVGSYSPVVDSAMLEASILEAYRRFQKTTRFNLWLLGRADGKG